MITNLCLNFKDWLFRMNLFSRLFQNLSNWFRSWFVRPYQTRFLSDDDFPKSLRKKTIYIVQENGYLWHASMLCPCECGETLYMNLIPDERPFWRLVKHQNGTVSLHPSVWRKKGCLTHFWFQKGQVHLIDK